MDEQELRFGVAPIVAIEVSRMYVNHKYQRPLDKLHVDGIVRKYSSELMTPITVAKMPNGYAVMEGQHRYEAAKRLGINLLPCIVTNMSEAEQAIYFVRANESRKPVSRADRHRAMVCAGDPIAISVERAVEAVGTNVTGGSHMAFRCIGALYRAVQTEKRLARDGLVERALRTLVQAWPTSETARKADFVTGVMLFYATYWDDVRDADVIDKFAMVDPRKVVADIDFKKAGDRSGLANPAARVFCEMFNAKRRASRLDLARLEEMHNVLKGMKPSPETNAGDNYAR